MYLFFDQTVSDLTENISNFTLFFSGLFLSNIYLFATSFVKYLEGFHGNKCSYFMYWYKHRNSGLISALVWKNYNPGQDTQTTLMQLLSYSEQYCSHVSVSALLHSWSILCIQMCLTWTVAIWQLWVTERKQGQMNEPQGRPEVVWACLCTFDDCFLLGGQTNWITPWELTS